MKVDICGEKSMKDSKKSKSGWAALPLCLAILLPGGASEAAVGVKAMRGGAHEAIAVLQLGLKDGATLEESSNAGFKAQAALMGQRMGRDAVCGETCIAAAEKETAGNTPALTAEEYTPSHLRPATAVPPPGKEKKEPGLMDKAMGAIGSVYNKIDKATDKWGKAKKIAVLVGLLAVEAAVIIYPTQVLTVAVTALGVLGLFGTVRELIGMYRRGRL